MFFYLNKISNSLMLLPRNTKIIFSTDLLKRYLFKKTIKKSNFNFVIKNFSLKKMDEIFDTMLEKYVPKFNIAEKVELKLPKLKKIGKEDNTPQIPAIKLPKLKKLEDKINV